MSEYVADSHTGLEPNDVPADRTARQVRSQSGRYQFQTGDVLTVRRASKRITFDPPIYAKCMSLDGRWCSDCLVVIVWESGAQLQVQSPADLSEFILLFTSSQSPVRRRCKRVWTNGNKIEVEYKSDQTSYSMRGEHD
jgi:hypothetical protein